MTTDNPFSTLHTVLAAPPGPSTPASYQPFQFIAAMAVAATLVFIGSNAWQWFSDMGSYRERFAYLLPMMLTNWLAGLLFHSAAILLLVHHQRERHAIACFRPMGGLLPAFAALYLVAALIAGAAISWISLPFYEWALEQDGRDFWMWSYNHLTSLLGLLLGCLLPLWLMLRLARSRSELLAVGQPASLPGWQVALGVALCFISIAWKLLGILSYSLSYSYMGSDGTQTLIMFASCTVPFAIVMAAVQTHLPARVSRFSAGRVLAASLVLLALWAVAIVLGAILTALAVYNSPSFDSLPLYLLPPAALLLALLWPLARWCTGWFFAEQLAQSSPR